MVLPVNIILQSCYVFKLCLPHINIAFEMETLWKHLWRYHIQQFSDSLINFILFFQDQLQMSIVLTDGWKAKNEIFSLVGIFSIHLYLAVFCISIFLQICGSSPRQFETDTAVGWQDGVLREGNGGEERMRPGRAATTGAKTGHDNWQEQTTSKTGE